MTLGEWWATHLTGYLNTYVWFQIVGLILGFLSSTGTSDNKYYSDGSEHKDNWHNNFFNYTKCFFIPGRWTLFGIFVTILWPIIPIVCLGVAAVCGILFGVLWCIYSVCTKGYSILNRPLFPGRQPVVVKRDRDPRDEPQTFDMVEGK